MAEGIKCPKCGHQFELSEMFTNQIRAGLRDELEVEVKAREDAARKLQET